MTYDSQNRLTDVDVTYQGQSQEIQGFTYGYDANGNRKSFTQIAPAITASYTYTGGNVLQSDTINGTTTNFTYDGNGNQTGSTGGPAFTYNAKEQTTTIGSNTYKYSGPDQQDRVQINSLTLDYSGLGLSRQ